MKKHEMKLLKEPFEEMRSGRKTVEMRLFDEKRQGIAAGDTVFFTCAAFPKEKLCRKVRGVYIYEDFLSLAESFPAEKLGFAGASADYIAEYMNRIYPEEERKKHGTAAIELEF